jgi:formate-dependent nitrite reductase membrane component NrfD
LSHLSRVKLERTDGWALVLELALLILFLGSLGASLDRWPLTLLLVGTLGGGVCLPLALRMWPRLFGRRTSLVAVLLVLVGGFVLRYSILAAAPAVLERSPAG